jgi:MFS family permease
MLNLLEVFFMGKLAFFSNVAIKMSRKTSSLPARYAFGVLYGISFLNYLDRYVLIGSANVVAKELGFQLDGIGYVTSAFLVVYTLTTLPLGFWADRVPRKNVVALSVALWSIATSVTALATNFLTLFLSRMILGVGEAGYFPSGTALLSDYFSRSRRSRVMSLWSTAQFFGILGGYAIGGALAGLYPGSWRLAFIFTGLPGLLLAFMAWRVREPQRNQADKQELARENEQALHDDAIDAHASSASEPHSAADQPASWQASLRHFWAQGLSLLRIKTLVVLIVMQIFAYFVLGVNTTFLPTYLQQKDTFALSSGIAGLYSGGVIVLAGLIGTTLGGYMADLLNKRYPGARVLVCGIGFLLGAPAYALAVISHNLLSFTVFFVLTSLLLTVYTGPCTAATQDVAPAILRSSAVAISLLLAHLFGDAFAPSLVGALATAFDPTHLRFAAGMAGQDLRIALLWTCVPALLLAGLTGILGSRWMGNDVEAAERADALELNN